MFRLVLFYDFESMLQQKLETSSKTQKFNDSHHYRFKV